MTVRASISRRTWAVLGVSVVAVAAMYAAILAGGDAALYASDIGETAIVWAAAAFTLSAALSFSPGEELRRQWLLIGIGVVMYAMGDTVWAFIELVQKREVPYPGLADLFYVLQYVFFAVGVSRAALAFRGIFDVRKPAIYAGGIGAVLAGAQYVFVLHPIVVGESGIGEKALNLFYPLGDVLLELVPALFILFVVANLGRGSLGWPWRAVAVAMAVMAVTDTAFVWLQNQDLYASGMVVDVGWALGNAAIAVGASLARDIAHPLRAGGA